ncbi:MAG TPA: choice-of-anchor Q domain-containing protein [Candidatus Limnocylindrales bacterium]|nr:choice-of-anchor Q domain-containing protein [Candidatus Limnocylindrales bacterium]
MSPSRHVRTDAQPMRALTAALALVFIGLLVPLRVPSVAAVEPASAVLTVDQVLDDPAATACTDAAPADCSLRGALINANADGAAEIETVVVPSGSYELTVPGGDHLSGSLNVSASVVIQGAGSGTTFIDANGLDRVLLVLGPGPTTDTTLVASGLTLRGGQPCAEPGGDDGNNGGGGGIYVHGIAHLTDVVVEDNATCGSGGGIQVDRYESQLTLTRSIVRGNTALRGSGGILSEYSLTMVDSTVSGNLADGSAGGGLGLAGTATITGSTISSNTATARGAGIVTGDDTTDACCAATVTITNSTISGNFTKHYNSGTPQYFSGSAGGIYVGRSNFTLRHVTVTENVAATNPNTGGIGIGAGIITGSTSVLTIENSIIAGNVGREECQLAPTTTYTFVGSFGCSVAGIQDPQLAPLADNGGQTATHALLAGNPAVDSADPTLCRPTDQRGVSRPSGAGCDMGAFELQVAPPPPPPPPPAVGPADAVVVVTSSYSVPSFEMTAEPRDFRFDLARGTTSLAAFDGDDLFGPGGPTGYVVGIDVLDAVHGDALSLTQEHPADWLPLFGGDCAPGGALRIRPGQLLTCAVANVQLDEFQAAATAAVVVEQSFPATTVNPSSFDVELNPASGTGFGFDAQDAGPDGRWTLGFAAAHGNPIELEVSATGPAGWLAILGADCAAGSLTVTELTSSSCTIEWFEVGIPPDPDPDPIVDLVVDDCSAASLATVTAVTGNLVVTDATCSELSLPNLTSIAGDLVVSGNPTLTDLALPNLDRIEGDLVITGNGSLVDVDLSGLAFVGGNLTVTQNTAVDQLATSATAVGGDMDVSQNATLTVITMPDVETVGGDMTLTANPTLTTIDMPAVDTVGGDMDISGNATLTDVSAPTLTIIGGDVDVSNNASMTNVSAPSVTTIGGDLDVSGNATMTNVSAPSLTTIGGDLDVTTNASLTIIELPTVTTIGGDVDVSQNATIAEGPSLVLHLPALISVGGSMTISENVQLASVDAPAVTTVGGDMDISGNATLTTIEAPEIETVGGDMTLTGNPSLTVFEAPSLETVEGDLSLEIQAATIELGTVNVAGSSTVVGTDTDRLTAATALGATSFQLINGLAALDATLPDGTFATNVGYAIERLGGSDLDPAGLIDPLAAYHLDFDIPTLGVDAAITFTIDLDEMSSAERQSFLDALAAGRATLAVRSDGSATYETIDVCAAGQTPAVDGCVAVRTDGSIVTFDGVAGHFSTWAVVVVASPDVVAPVVTVPDDKRLEATGSAGRTVAFASEVSALDDRDGEVATECAPASGSTFPLGTTTVTCGAVDAAGNEGSATFHVTIIDSTAPAITVPATIVVTATAANGATVTYSASASDLVSGIVPVSCTPLSGTTFAVGQTTVTCGATDGAGNAGTGTFVVRVLGPVDLLTGLRNDVNASVPNVAPKLAADLAGKLDDAILKLGQKKTADACKKVQEFMTKVTDESAKRKVPGTLATDWLDRARQVRTLLGC